MRHVGIKRFGPGHSENDRTEDEKPEDSVMRYEPHGVQRIERGKNRGMGDDRNQARRGDRDKPEGHDRAEDDSHALRSSPLNRKQPQQDSSRDRNDKVLCCRRGDTQSLDRRDHRDRGRDHPVANNHRSSDHGHPEKPVDVHRNAEYLRRLGSRQQGENPALAVVIDAHQNRDVLNANDEEKRPNEQRDDADRILYRRSGIRTREAGLDRVKRAGSDLSLIHI